MLPYNLKMACTVLNAGVPGVVLFAVALHSELETRQLLSTSSAGYFPLSNQRKTKMLGRIFEVWV